MTNAQTVAMFFYDVFGTEEILTKEIKQLMFKWETSHLYFEMMYGLGLMPDSYDVE